MVHKAVHRQLYEICNRLCRLHSKVPSFVSSDTNLRAILSVRAFRRRHRIQGGLYDYHGADNAKSTAYYAWGIREAI